MTNRTAYVECRSQHAKGSGPGAGPDTYFAVQVVPAEATRLLSLNHTAAAKRGIEIIYCGEGYSNRQQTERSMYNRAKAAAHRVAAEINNA